MKYCVLYVNRNECNEIKGQIAHLDFVNHVEISAEEEVNLDSQHIENQLAEMAQKQKRNCNLNKKK